MIRGILKFEEFMAVITYDDWCRERGVTHAHCPEECEHPQPVVIWDGRLMCLRCKAVDGVETEMVACTPETCGDD